MELAEVLAKLESLGTAQNRKVYARHGARGEVYGVSYGNFTQLKKKIKVDHDLALALWATGVHDARIFATMVADPSGMTARQLDAWARDLDNYMVTDAFAGLAKETPLAQGRMEKWTKMKGEWVGSAGYHLLSHLARTDETLSDAYLEEHLKRIEAGIATAKNRTRYSMNGALISIGMRNSELEKKAIAAAERIGKVDVDHGETSCKTPDAVAYIRKGVEHKRKKVAK